MSWARANIRFVQGVEVAYNSAQEGAAILTWNKHQRVELLKTIATVTATVNPEQAQKSLNLLIEEMFPSQRLGRAEAVDKALEIMESEQKRVYSIKKTQQKKNAFGRRIKRALGKRR